MRYNPFAYIHYEAPEEEQNFAALLGTFKKVLFILFNYDINIQRVYDGG